MTHTYNISGMTCNGCAAKVKSEFLKLGNIIAADVQLAPPQATLTMQKHIPTATLQAALQKAGNYTIQETGNGMPHGETHTAAKEETRSWLATYKPILLIFLYLTVITLITATYSGRFDAMLAMRIFMSGFFLTFSFFKLLDLDGFADSYSTYDIIAKKVRSWGYIYAFIELFLGISYAANFQPLLTNAVTFVVMSISIVGVLQSVLNKRKIRCACLGAVFNLPMSTITIIEDALMIAMSLTMLIVLL